MQVDVAEMGAAIERTSQACHSLEQGLAPHELVPQLRAAVEEWQAIVALVAALQRPHVQERHWKKVAAALPQGLEVARDMPVGVVLESGMTGAQQQCASARRCQACVSLW